MKPPIKMDQNNWGDILGIQSPQTIRQFKGINTLDQFSIDDDYMIMNKNISTKKYPTASVREGSSPLGSITGPIMGIGIWKEKEIHAISNGQWKRWLGASWENLIAGLDATKKWSFTNFKGNFVDVALIAANGVDAVKVYHGTTITNLANAPAGMNYVVGHDNRLYGAVKNVLHYSALRLPTDWNTVDQSGQIVIENNSGEDISAVVGGTGKIVVMMPHSIHELYGTGPKNYRLQLISDETGCVTFHSVVTLGGMVYFLSHDGLYQYGGGAAPRKDFSLAVQTLLDRINISAYNKVSAGTDGERYYISFAIDSFVEPNITLEYDPKFNTWNVWEFSKTPTFYARAEEIMYVGTKEDCLLKMSGTTDTGQAIPFEMRTKPFTSSSLMNKKRLHRLWVVADIPIGAVLNISLSNDDDGLTWTQVKSISGNANIMGQQIEIPTNQSFFNQWVRIKLDGTGAVIIHEITRQERTSRMGIGGG